MSKKFEDFLKARDARAEQNESIRKKRAEFNAAQSRSAVDRKYESFINSLRPDERQDLFTSSDERNSEMREWISSVMSQDRYAELESKARNTYIPAQFGQQMLSNQRMRAYQERYQGTYVPASLSQDAIRRNGAGNDYNAYSDAMLRGEYLRNTDTGAMQKELDALNKELDERKKYYDGAKKSLGIVRRTKGEDDPLYLSYANQITDYEAKQARAGELQKDIYDATNLQTLSKYAGYSENADFKDYATRGAAIDNPTWSQSEKAGIIPTLLNGERSKINNPVSFYLENQKAGGEEAYEFMNKDELDTYNYTLAKYGESEANKYLSALRPQLNQRSTSKITGDVAEIADKYPILSSGASILMSPLKGMGYIDSVVSDLSGQRIDTNNRNWLYGNMQDAVLDTVSKNIESGWSGSVGSFLYNTGMSIANNAALVAMTGGTPAGQAASLAIMGLGSSSDNTKDALRRGATQEQALQLGALAGIAEVLFEKVSLDNFIKLSAPGARGAFLKNVLKQAGIEASEEVATEVANIIADNAVMGDLSNYNLAVNAYVSDGMSREEAKKKASIDSFMNVLLAGAGGALSGGVMGIGGQTVGNLRAASIGRNSGIDADALIRAAVSMPENSAARELAQRISDGSTKRSNVSIGNLASTYAQEGGDISALMSPSPASSAEEDPLRRAAYEVAEKKLQGNTQNAEEFSMPSKAQIQPVERVPANEASNASNAIAMPDNAATASDTANAKRAEIGSASEIASKLSSAFSASPELNVYADENGSINIDRNGKSYAKMDEREARAMVSSYDGSVNAIDYASGFHAAYSYAVRGIELSQIKDNSISVRDLTDAQLYAAYAAGRNVHFKENAPAESALSARRAAALSPDSTEFQPGVNRIVDTKLSNKQESQIRVLDALGRKYGVEIILDDALYHENGGKQGQHSGDNAFYNPNTKRIHINQNALGEAYLAVGMHELTHYIKDNNTKAYDTLEAFILSALEERGENVRALIDYQMEHNGYSEDVAREEVVANTIPAILNDESYVKKLVEADRTLAERIRDFLQEFIDTIKETLRTLEGEASWKQMQSIRQDTELLSAIADMFDAVLGETSSERGKAKEGVMLSTRERAGFARDRYYDRQIQRWDDLTDGARIKVGEVKLGSALNAVGLHDTGMYFDVGKIKKVMREHGDHLTENIMQQIPDLLSNPIVITQYSENTISVYGDLFVGNTPVVVGVVMNRGANGQTLINKIRTIHARKDFASQITDHNVLYLNEDKKRTRSWFQVCGIHVPLDGNKFGLIRSIRDSSEKINRFSAKDTEKRAVEHFGKTYSWNETGYITTSGARLDFSGRHEGAPGGYRTVDHRDILDAYGEDSDMSGSEAMVDFMAHGNIRISPESGGINLSVMPTAAQYEKLEQFVQKYRGEVMLDIDDTDGNTLHSVEYPRNTRASKVLNDIRNYFENGTVPEVSVTQQFRFSAKDERSVSIKQQIAEHQDELNEMKPVASIESGRRPQRNGKPDRTLMRKSLQAFYGSLQYSVDRKNLGKVSFDENALSELVHYIKDDAEFAAAKTAPAVIKRGIQADHHIEHKGHSDVESYTFAAPVTLNGKRGNVAVVVQYTNRNKPHCVRILLPDGSGFDLGEMTKADQDRSAATIEGGRQQLIESASFNSISESGENSNPRFSLKDASPVDVSALQQENEKLAQSLDVALDQTKLTHGHRVKAGLLGTLAGKTVRDYKSEYSASTLKENLVRIFEFLSSSKNPNMNEVHELGVGLMKAVLEKSNRFDSDGYNAYSKERDYLHNTGIAFSDTQKKEAAALFDTFGKYRSSMFGSVKITTDGVPLDTAWQELSEMNSELFPPDTNASDMPRALMIAHEALKRDNFYVNDFGYDLDSAAADAWSNLLEAYYKSQTFDSGKDKIADLNQKMRDLRNAARKEAKAVEREIIRNAEGHAKEIEKRDRRETALRDMILLERVRKRINPNGGTLNPTQIASLDISEFSSTPKLDSIDASSERGGKSKFFESADKSQNVSEETRELIQNDDDVKYYANITNSDTLDEANNRLNSLGASETQRWQAMDPGSATATDVAEGFILLKRYQDAGDYESAVTVIKKLRQMGSRAGQTTQAFSIMGRLTPEAMNMYAQKELDDLRAELVKRFGEKWVDDRSDMFQLTPDEAENIKVLIEQASLLPDGRDKNVILARISSMLEAKIPTNAGKIVKALARNFMLLNTKTMIRNVLGNAIMMPAYIAQDFIGSGIDRALSRSTGIRTTGNTLPSKSALKAAKKGLFESYDDFRLNINTRQIDNDRFEIGSGNAFRKYSMERIRAAHAIKRPVMLLSNALNMMDRITGFLLDAGDRPFFEYHFTNALNNQLRLNNAAEPTSEMIEVATAEALMRTWQDDNSVTKAASTVRNMLNPKQSNGFGIGTLLIPFTKTPANLVKALADYSPVGLVNALARKSRAYAYAVKKGTVTVEMQKRFVDALSKGITGTLIMAIAASLAARGILTGGDDDEDRDLAAFKKNILGIAPYSAVIDGKSYSYDWAQPVGGLAAISADLVQNIKSGKEAVKGFSIGSDDAENRKLSGNVGSVANAILNALSAGGNVIFEQSFLSGIKNLFSEDGVVNGLSNALLNSTTQFIPTALGQIAQISDPYARTYYETGNLLGTTSNRLKAKIPGIRNELAAVVDVMGNDVLAIGGLNVFFNPANVYPENATAAALEIYRVYQETGALSAIPRVAGYSMEYDNVKYEFTSHERSQYQRMMGKTNTEIVEDLLKSKAYASLDDAEKAAVLSNVTTYANAIAKEEFLSSKNVTYDFGPLSWVEKARNGKKVALNVDDYIVAKTVVRDIDSGLKDADGDTIKNSKGLLIMEAVYAVPGLCTLPDKQRLYLFESLGVGKDVRHWNKSLVEQELAKMR